MSDTFSATETATRLGVTREWLMGEARASRVPHVRLGRFVRFTEANVQAILRAASVEPREANPNAPSSRSEARRRSA